MKLWFVYWAAMLDGIVGVLTFGKINCGLSFPAMSAYLNTAQQKRAVDEGDSSAPEGDTSPEVLSAGEAGSTSALHH